MPSVAAFTAPTLNLVVRTSDKARSRGDAEIADVWFLLRGLRGLRVSD
jgi:hypothetical protein